MKPIQGMSVANKVDDVQALVGLAACGELFHAAGSGDCPETYATIDIKIEGRVHQETWRLDSSIFRSWLLRRFFDTHQKMPAGRNMMDAMDILSGKAMFGGNEHEVHVRLAPHSKNIWVDLGDREWNAIEITGDGWRVVSSDKCPVKFRRPRGMLELVTPLRTPDNKASILRLRQFINAETEEAWILIVSWLIGTFHYSHRFPFPILCIQGQAGSAKSTSCRMLRSLIDPNSAPLRSPPRTDQEVMITGSNSWTVVIDNVSHLTVAQSNALCRLATGGGFGSRELYTNTSESILGAQRPIMLTGIDDFAVKEDLLQRSILITMPKISDDNRQTEQDLWRDFEKEQPIILGGLLDAIVEALSSDSTLVRKPRMADFAEWIHRAEPRLPWKRGRFIEVYRENQEVAREVALMNIPIVEPLLRIIKARNVLTETASKLLELLNVTADISCRSHKGWPVSPQQLREQLKHAQRSLEDQGIHLSFRRINGYNNIRLEYHNARD